MENGDEKLEEIWLPCMNCDRRTAHQVLKEVEDDRSSPDERLFYYFQIVRCAGCKAISFRRNWQSSDEMTPNFDNGEDELDDHEDLYPSRIAGRKELKGADLLPVKILSLYRETHHALCYRLPVLAGIGIRGLIEAVCKEKNAKGRYLADRIDALIGLGWLSRDGATILHGTRLLGNEAAHEAASVPEQQLDAAMDVVEHLLQGVFIIPDKAKDFPKPSPQSQDTATEAP